MGITLKATLRTNKADKAGLCPVAIAIRGNRDEAYYHIGLKIRPEQWADGQITKEVPNADIMNNRIKSVIAQSDRAILMAESAVDVVAAKQIVHDIAVPDTKKANDSGNFVKFYRAYVDNLIATKKKAPATIAIWETEYRQFTDLFGLTFAFSKLTAAFLDSYHRKLAAKDYEPTTIHKKLKKLTQIIRNARKKGLVNREGLEGFEMVRYQDPETHYLTLDQVTDLADRVYRGELDYNPVLKLVACFFLVECYAGIRFSDWRKFEVEKLIHKRKFKVRATKNKEPIYLDLTIFKSLDKIVTYIKDNGLRFNETEKTANLHLKTIGILIKLKFPLRTHYGRHTFGTLLGEMGYSTRFIAEAMGIDPRTAKRYITITKQTMHSEQERLGGF